ncbi:MAG: hypothetical protein EZS28_041582 [Streblomastix strix]|uniref:Uncharacterized protein n=1 Tax=Streblomastix strix TaxID=222440 RepID=A0A5J4TZ13_9EUKA|nr:MAG: hypothetical protein EZS28_041582 [Streblomastix strix]
MINSGIVDSLLKILSTWELDQITQPYIKAFFRFTYPSCFEIIQQLHQKQSLPTLLRLLNHKDEDVISDSIVSVNNIIYYGAIGTNSTSLHPYYQEIAQIGGIEKIFEQFRRTKHEDTKNISATCLGIVFRAREMTDNEMKVEIISHLKSIINHQREDIRKVVKLALKCLAQNQANRSEIVKDGFVVPDD